MRCKIGRIYVHGKENCLLDVAIMKMFQRNTWPANETGRADPPPFQNKKMYPYLATQPKIRDETGSVAGSKDFRGLGTARLSVNIVAVQWFQGKVSTRGPERTNVPKC